MVKKYKEEYIKKSDKNFRALLNEKLKNPELKKRLG
jgi:hypothetical protein